MLSKNFDDSVTMIVMMATPSKGAECRLGSSIIKTASPKDRAIMARIRLLVARKAFTKVQLEKAIFGTRRVALASESTT